MVKHSTKNFTVVINPEHGPGPSAWPSGQYVSAIKKLSVFPNVQTVGYIDTEKGSRDDSLVRQQIATYAGWNKSEIALSGIFFDHTPSSDIGEARGYLKNISATVRHSEGFVGEALVIHNPGVVPDEEMTRYRADVTVVFQGAYREMPTMGDMKGKLRGLSGRREDYAYLVDSTPLRIKKGGFRRIINGVRRDVQWLYVTDRVGDDRYTGYCSVWGDFLDLTF